MEIVQIWLIFKALVCSAYGLDEGNQTTRCAKLVLKTLNSKDPNGALR